MQMSGNKHISLFTYNICKNVCVCVAIYLEPSQYTDAYLSHAFWLHFVV